MFVNKIYKLNRDEYRKISVTPNFKESFVTEIQGNKIQDLDSYLNEIWDKFNFPKTGFINYNAYLDWIRDLEWIKEEAVILTIFDFNEFLKDDLELKNEIIEDFTDMVLPWWQEEVQGCVVDGFVKPFNVFLVD